MGPKERVKMMGLKNGDKREAMMGPTREGVELMGPGEEG